jgi:C-terminal processing protease CtpA/Prc
LEPMNFGGTLKVTVGKRYSPKWLWIEKKGITPDIYVGTYTGNDIAQYSSSGYNSAFPLQDIFVQRAIERLRQ